MTTTLLRYQLRKELKAAAQAMIRDTSKAREEAWAAFAQAVLLFELLLETPREELKGASSC